VIVVVAGLRADVSPAFALAEMAACSIVIDRFPVLMAVENDRDHVRYYLLMVLNLLPVDALQVFELAEPVAGCSIVIDLFPVLLAVENDRDHVRYYLLMVLNLLPVDALQVFELAEPVAGCSIVIGLFPVLMAAENDRGHVRYYRRVVWNPVQFVVAVYGSSHLLYDHFADPEYAAGCSVQDYC
jgi:hypothetical protein